MKKLFALAILTAMLAACGGKAAPATTNTDNTGGTMEGAAGGDAYGGDTYGGDAYGDMGGEEGGM